MPKGRDDGGRSSGNPGEFDPSSDFSPPQVPDRVPAEWSKKARNIKETRAWKDGTQGATRFWSNYVATLKMAFGRMDRRQQEELITRMSQIITVGAAVITTYIWYWFMPQGVRVIVLPIVLIASWYLGARVVAPSMIARFESQLSPDYEEVDNE